MAKGKSGKRSKASGEKRTSSTIDPNRKKGNQGKQAFHRTQTKEKAPAGPNPYDLFQNKSRKFAVLGERRSGEKRNLAKSRAAAVNDRGRSLLKEKLTDRRTSSFRDGRIGGDANSSVQRLVKLRQKQSKKSFALGAKGAEELTHGGKTIKDLADADLKDGQDEDSGGEEWDPDDPVGKGKIRKAQERQERQEHDSQLGKLDDGFTDILGELSFRPPKAKQLLEKNKPDEYDRLTRELAYERKAVATERTKTPEEIAREQASKLEGLEIERSRRINAELEEAPPEGEEDETGNAPEGLADDSEPEGSEADGEGEESEEEQNEDGDDEVESEKKSEAVPAEAQAEGAEVDDDDRLGENCIPLLPTGAVSAVDTMVNTKSEKGLPYSLQCPVRKRAIAELLAGRGPKTAVKLVQRVRTCTAVALAAGNREKLRAFFLALLEYVASVAVREDGDLSAKGLQILYALRPQILQLAREHPEEAHDYFAERLRVLSPSTLPQVSEVCCLKLIALLFPTTDFSHPITTPAVLLADHWATRLATLGSEIAELVSEAVFLWGALYDITASGTRFSTSLFKLGITILDSCWASAGKGREQITDASADIMALLLKILRDLAESEPVAAHVVCEQLIRPTVEKVAARGVADGAASEQLKALTTALDEIVTGQNLTPLMLFDAPPPQIRVLDPIFHEEGDMPRHKGMVRTETQLLKQQLNDERRAARRQLRRDAAALQTMAAHKDDKRRVARSTEKKRVWSMMDAEKSMLKQMMTENGGGMDTSLQSYSSSKQDKKDNKRMGGNATADSAPKGAKTTEGKDSTQGAKTTEGKFNKVRKTPKKRGSGRK